MEKPGLNFDYVGVRGGLTGGLRGKKPSKATEVLGLLKIITM